LYSGWTRFAFGDSFDFFCAFLIVYDCSLFANSSFLCICQMAALSLAEV